MNKAIFWDSDGTLIYGNESFAFSLVKACEEVGCHINIDDSRKLMRSICSWYVPEYDHSGRNGEEWWGDLLDKIGQFCRARNIEDERIAKIGELFRKYVIEYDYQTYDDALEVLQYFSEHGFKNYIISNNFPELGQVFKNLGLDKYISGYTTSASAGYEKPDINIYNQAMRAAGYPDVCYMIGDNPKTDYAGGLAAGMKPVLVHNEDAGCECSCAKLVDLKNIIIE